MQKFPLRNQCKPNNNKAFGSDTHIRKRVGCRPHEMQPPPPPPPQRLQRICQPISSDDGTIEKCQLSMMKKPATKVKVCDRLFTKVAENVATWDKVLSIGCNQSKSLPSAVSSSLVAVDSNTAAAERQEGVQPTTSAGGILEVPCNVTASSSTTSTNKNNTDANGNKNKDDDDDNNRRSRQQKRQLQQHHQRITQAEAAVMPAAALAREFMTSERLRLGDQINLLLFDPYRTLKFLITELKSRLKTVVPDDINVQKILLEIQQTMKRIRIPNASETLLQPVPPRTTTTTTTTTSTSTEEEAMAATTATATVEYILPKERCHVIKNDPLINHAKKVNSSCQTIASQLENVNACQMCEHPVNQATAGCNQCRINEYSNADDGVMEMHVTGAFQQRSKDHRKDMDVQESFSCMSLQDAIENLKIKNNPFSQETQRIITQLESELSNFQRELQRTSSSLSMPSYDRPLGMGSAKENLKVQGKRLLDKKREKPNEEEETFPDFIADKVSCKNLKQHCKKLNSSTQVVEAFSISKESQTKLKSSTQVFCHLEKEKLLLLEQFRITEMQTIQEDLNELHVFIKDQLNGIYHSITRENLNLKYHYSNDRKGSADKNKQKIRQKIFLTLQQPKKTQTEGLPPLSSSPSLTASTSSVLSSNQMHGGGTPLKFTSILPRHYKKSSPIPTADSGNANNTKSMMKQKSSSSSVSAADAKENHNISDVDKADKALGGEKKSKDPHRQLYGQKHLFVNCRCRCRFPGTPFCSGGEEKNNFPDVDCGCPFPCTRTQMDDKVQRMMTAKATRTSTTKGDINPREETPLPASGMMVTHRQRHQQSATMTEAAQGRIQLISSSLQAAAPSYITTRTTDETSVNPDTVTNAAIKTIIKDACATTVTTNTAAAAVAPGHSNGIRVPSHQTHNCWQRVNLKNPTGCQLEKQICGADGYECKINNNNDNRSNYPEIHDCQKYRANSINPFCGLCSAKMHEVGVHNGATATAFASAATTTNTAFHDVKENYKGYVDDVGAGGDGPFNWNEENESVSVAVQGDSTCHPKKRLHRQQRWRRQKQAALLHCCSAQSAIQTDLEEFKEFLDEIILSTP